MARTLKMCLVVFAWATIGTQIALSFSPSWLALILGLVGGSLGGVLTCEWRTVVWAIPIAWRRATEWRPNYNLLREGLKGLAIVGGFIVWVACNALPLVLLALYVSPSIDKQGAVYIMWMGVVLGTGFCCLVPIAIVNVLMDPRDEATKNLIVTLCQMNVWILTSVTFILAVKAVPTQLRRAVRYLLDVFHRVVSALMVAARFCWHYYKLVHTEELRLVAVDIAVGIMIGFIFGLAIVGGLAGTAFWVANRLLIAGLLLKTMPVRVR